MQGEKTIVAHFPDSSAAYKTAKSLHAAELGSAKISQLTGDSTNYNPAGSEYLTDLANPTYDDYANAEINNAESVLNAADTEEGDYSDLERRYTLTLSTTGEKADQAVNIIRKFGGMF